MILGFVGNPRNGKTLMAVAYAYALHLKGYKVYSYRLNTTFSETISVNDLMSFELEEGVLIIDEVHTLIDSRNQNQLSRLLSYFWTQSGKRNLTIIYTTQIAGMVDLRLREIADYIFECKKVYSKNKALHKKIIKGFRYTRVVNETYLNTKFMAIDKAKRFFPMFNTYQRILPLELDASDAISFSHIKRLYEKATTKKGFVAIVRAKYNFISWDNCVAVYDCLKADLEDEAKQILKIKK